MGARNARQEVEDHEPEECWIQTSALVIILITLYWNDLESNFQQYVEITLRDSNGSNFLYNFSATRVRFGTIFEVVFYSNV